MKKKPFPSDLFLWLGIVAYTGIIYSTLSIVPLLRKFLVERFGQGVFDFVYIIFGIIAIAIVSRALISLRGKHLVYRLLAIVIIGAMYAYYLIRLPYAIERIHLLEYGLLGVLLYIGLYRKVPNWLALPLAFAALFCAGLGDEGIQAALPSRVGEIRDCVTDLFSGMLGIGLYVFAFGKAPSIDGVRGGQVRFLLALLSLATACTALFISRVHGFGYVHETSDTGRIYSSLSREEFDKINSADASALPPSKKTTYDNEALRHLLQRDFYFTNDFLIKGGGYYRDYWKSLAENNVLENYYRAYMNTHADEKSAALLGKIDKTVAKNIGDIPVIWPDSLKEWVAQQAGTSNALFSSRVKSTVIISFTFNDTMFYVALILLLLGYAWVKAGRAQRC